MSRFFRAINVTGRKVKMDDLRDHFESIGFSDVETYIASGNVGFATPSDSARSLEKGIEKTLGCQSTLRGANTIKKMAARFAGSKS